MTDTTNAPRYAPGAYCHSCCTTGRGSVAGCPHAPPAPAPAPDADALAVEAWMVEWRRRPHSDLPLVELTRDCPSPSVQRDAASITPLCSIEDARALIEQQARELAELHRGIDRQAIAAATTIGRIRERAERAERELAEAREQRDNARAVTRDICEEWNEECDCEKLPMALGHGEQCKAVSIRAAKAALRERAERAEADLAAARECIAAADAREVLEVRAVFDSWRKNEVCPSEWGAFFAGYQRGVAATKGSSEPGLHIPGTPTHTIEGLPACVQGACAEDVAVRLPDKGRAAANEAATRAVPAGANPAPSP